MIRYLRTMRVSSKLWTISLAYSLPITVMLYLMVAGINKDIQFGQMELYGNEYQRPLESLLDLVPQHQLLTVRAAAGDAAAREQLSTRQGQIDRAFDSLDAVDQKLGATLQFTDEGLSKRKRDRARASSLKKEWQDIKLQLASSKATSADDMHRQLIADIRTMITHSGDISNLILDPDLDSYYMMDATLCALPQTQDRTAVIAAYADGVLRRKTLTPEDRTQLAVHAALLKESDMDRVTGSLQTALNEDANFYGSSETLQRNLPGSIQSYSAATQALLDLTHRLATSENVEIEPAEFAAAAARAREESFKLWNVADNELDVLIQKRIDNYRAARTWGLGLCGGALLITGLLVVFLVRSIKLPLAAIAEMLGGSASQVTSASRQVASSGQSLAQGASQQAASLEEASSALQQMSSMTRKNAQTAQQARGISGEAETSAGKGNQAMQRMSSAINEIQKSAADTARIIKVIDEIAFQTNLLALNAAVEAARAGEAGKGFAVVADEVRNLAMRSAEAAKNTANLIEQSVQSARNGVAITVEVGKVLDEITAASTKVNGLVAEIAAASQEQSQGFEQVSTAVAQMDSITQQNAANAEESAAASEEMAAQAEQLNGVVRELANLVGGQALRTPQPASHASSPAPAQHRPAPPRPKAAHLIPLDEHERAEKENDFSAFNSSVK